MKLGRKILVIGPNGSGKTTLGKKLSKQTGLPFYELDHYFWKAGWQETDEETFRNKIINITSGNCWIIDGNYAKNQDLTLTACDTVIWLDVPRYISVYRVSKRAVKRSITKETLWHDNTESFRRMFSKHSIITFAFFSHKRKKIRITKYRKEKFKDKNWIRISNNKELKKFWSELNKTSDEIKSPDV